MRVAGLELRGTSIEESALLDEVSRVENVFRRLVRKARDVGREVGGGGMGKVQGFELARVGWGKVIKIYSHSSTLQHTTPPLL